MERGQIHGKILYCGGLYADTCREGFPQNLCRDLGRTMQALYIEVCSDFEIKKKLIYSFYVALI